MNHVTKALELFANGEGWMKGKLWDESGSRHCMVGALHKVSPDFFSRLDMQNIVSRVIHEQYPDRTHGKYGNFLPNFNDHPDTTFDDVRVVMEKAALIYEQKTARRQHERRAP